MTENKNNTTTLDEIMTKEPRRSTPIDLTKGKIENTTSVEEDKTVEKAKPVKKVNAVQSGPVDISSMEKVNEFDILPKSEPKKTYEDDLFSKLDEAVEREKASITKRIDDITEVQHKEFMDRMSKEEEKRLEEEDKFALEDSDDSFDADENYDYDEDDNYNTDSKIEVDSSVEHVSINSNDEVAENLTNEDEYHRENDQPTTKNETFLVNAANTEKITVDEENNSPKVEISDTHENTNEENSAKVTTIEKKEEPVKSSSENKENKISILDMVDDDSLFDDDDDSETGTDTKDEADEMFESLKTAVKEKITPIRKSFDLSKFTIAKKSVNAQKVMKLAVRNHQSIADWMMYSAQRPISLTGLSGPEILKLNPENSSRNRLNTFRDMYRIIYDHVYDANKPEFETWLKQVRFIDLQHIQFGLLMATFSGSNFITYTCPSCNKVFIKDVPFEDMVEYSSDEVKEKVKSILKMDTTSPSNDTYPVDLVQISDNYVFGLKVPSIWNVIIETAALSDRFLEKHADLIDIVSYIDSIYLIDEDKQELIAVDYKADPNDQAKTSARRIRAFYDIIRTLSSEDYYALRSKINEYDESSSDVTYKIPGCTCPECAAEIPANNSVTPDSMLFTRHQLAAIGNM